MIRRGTTGGAWAAHDPASRPSLRTDPGRGGERRARTIRPREPLGASCPARCPQGQRNARTATSRPGAPPRWNGSAPLPALTPGTARRGSGTGARRRLPRAARSPHAPGARVRAGSSQQHDHRGGCPVAGGAVPLAALFGSWAQAFFRAAGGSASARCCRIDVTRGHRRSPAPVPEAVDARPGTLRRVACGFADIDDELPRALLAAQDHRPRRAPHVRARSVHARWRKPCCWFAARRPTEAPGPAHCWDAGLEDGPRILLPVIRALLVT